MLTLCDTKVTTSHGRSHHFAPFIRTTQLVTPTSRRWIRLSGEHAAPIVGIFIDAVVYFGLRHCGIVGFTQDGQHQGVTNSADVSTLPEIYSNALQRGMVPPGVLSSHLTTASLSNISSLRVRRCGAKILGLFIRYSDSSVATLGQWDPLGKGSVSELYKAADGFLMRLHFHTVTDRGKTVQDITVDVTDNPWEHQAQQGHLAGADPKIQSFDCYQPTQVSKSPLQVLHSGFSHMGKLYSVLHGASDPTVSLCSLTACTSGPRCL